MDSIDATGTDPAPGLADEAAPERNRDDALRDAAIELLAEIGYDRLTMDAVAARARASKATIYRRWQNKAELVVDAVGCLKGVTPLPDSGSLAGDLREVCDAFGDDDSRLGAHVMLGLVTALARDEELRAVFTERMVRPRAERQRVILERAVRRGEIPEGRDLDSIGETFSALMLQRVILTGQAPDRDYAWRVARDVILPLATAPAAPIDPPSQGAL